MLKYVNNNINTYLEAILGDERIEDDAGIAEKILENEEVSDDNKVKYISLLNTKNK